MIAKVRAAAVEPSCQASRKQHRPKSTVGCVLKKSNLHVTALGDIAWRTRLADGRLRQKKNMGLSASWLDGIWQTVKHTYAVQNTSVSTTLYGLGHDFIIMFSTNLVLFGIWAVHINQCTDVSGFLGYIPVHSASHIWPLRMDQLFRHFAV